MCKESEKLYNKCYWNMGREIRPASRQKWNCPITKIENNEDRGKWLKISTRMKHPRTAPIEGMDMNNQQAIIVTREICVTTVSPAMTLGPVLIPRIPLIPRDTNMPFILERRLFPICSAFPVAINKRRDRHLDRSYLYSLKPLFLPKLYIILWRFIRWTHYVLYLRIKYLHEFIIKYIIWETSVNIIKNYWDLLEWGIRCWVEPFYYSLFYIRVIC